MEAVLPGYKRKSDESVSPVPAKSLKQEDASNGYDITSLMQTIGSFSGDQKRKAIIEAITIAFPEAIANFSLEMCSDVTERARAFMVGYEWDDADQKRAVRVISELYDIYLVNSGLVKTLPQFVEQIAEDIEFLEKANLEKILEEGKCLLKTLSFPEVSSAEDLQAQIKQIGAILFKSSPLDRIKRSRDPVEIERYTRLFELEEQEEEEETGDADSFGRFLWLAEENASLLDQISQMRSSFNSRREELQRTLSQALAFSSHQKPEPYQELVEKFAVPLWEGMALHLQALVEMSKLDEELSPILAHQKRDYLLVNRLCDEYFKMSIDELITCSFASAGSERMAELENQLDASSITQINMEIDLEMDTKEKGNKEAALKKSMAETCKDFFSRASGCSSLQALKKQISQVH